MPPLWQYLFLPKKNVPAHVDAAQATLQGAVRAPSHRFKSPQLVGVRTVVA
jgi:hypothetical protein